jgi:hypothetical protein
MFQTERMIQRSCSVACFGGILSFLPMAFGAQTLMAAG